MKKEELIEKAMQISEPSRDACAEYASKSELLAETLNLMMLKRDDLDRMIGKGNRNMMMDNHRNHARFMKSLFTAYSPEVFVDTILWVFRAYRSHGFQLIYWAAQLDNWITVMKQHLSKETYEELFPFYEFMLLNQPAFAQLTDEDVEKNHQMRH